MATHIVDVKDARSRLLDLISEAEEGIEVIVACDGRLLARIVACVTASSARRPGVWSGRVEYDQVTRSSA